MATKVPFAAGLFVCSLLLWSLTQGSIQPNPPETAVAAIQGPVALYLAILVVLLSVAALVVASYKAYYSRDGRGWSIAAVVLNAIFLAGVFGFVLLS